MRAPTANAAPPPQAWGGSAGGGGAAGGAGAPGRAPHRRPRQPGDVPPRVLRGRGPAGGAYYVRHRGSPPRVSRARPPGGGRPARGPPPAARPGHRPGRGYDPAVDPQGRDPVPLHRRRRRGRGRAGRAVRRRPGARPRRAAAGSAGAGNPRIGARRPGGLHGRCAAHRRPHRSHPQGVIADTRLGQHFLTDRTILEKIVDALDPAPDDIVLEIGAGTGTLTAVLCPRVRSVIAIEKDRRLARECGVRNAECGIDRLTVVPEGALRVDWHALVTAHSALRTPHFKIVGNIPYAITSPLIDKALTPPLPERVVFLVQAEVALRSRPQRGRKTTARCRSACRPGVPRSPRLPGRRAPFHPAPPLATRLLGPSPTATPPAR